MKFLLGILIISIVVNQVFTLIGEEESRYFDECAKELGIKAGKMQEKYDTKFKCVEACTAKKMGYMIDGKIDEAKFIEFTKKFNPKNETVKHDKLKDCLVKGNAEKHECDVFDVFVKCNDAA